MKIYVVAFEYVNPGPSANGGGHEWFLSAPEADTYYASCLNAGGENGAHFRFDLDVSDGLSTDEITDYVETVESEQSALAARRSVGRNVLAYWREEDMDMGSATKPRASEAQ